MIMKRLKRRVHNGDVDNTNKTFDRQSFTECSNRMKRIVPTLHREIENAGCISDISESPQNSSREGDSLDTGSLTESCLISYTGVMEMDSDSLTEFRDKRNLDSERSPAGCADIFPVSVLKDEDIDIPHTPVHAQPWQRNDFSLDFDSTPRARTKFISGSSTLPAVPSSHHSPSKKTLRRKILKPFVALASAMSQIGDNIHITSYPTP